MKRGSTWLIPAICAALSLVLKADEKPPAGELTAEQVWELKQSDATTAELEHRDALLAAELASGTAPEWAGVYTFGDGLGVNVRVVLAPQNGFIFTWHGCLGRYDANYGAVEEVNGRLRLNFLLPNERRSFAGASGTLVPVHWGSRLYLIDADHGADFANAINAGVGPGQPLIGRFLLRAGDENGELAGTPDLPPAIAHLLLEKPIDARVVKILDSVTQVESNTQIEWRITTVQIDAGTRDGVWTGMDFYPAAAPLVGSFTIESADETTSIAVMREFEPDEALPPAGFCVSTRMDRNPCLETAEPQLLSPT
jgi:hypothetical protein